MRSGAGPKRTVNEYRRDVDAAVAMVERNYAGYADKRKRFGAKFIDTAAGRARDAAAKAKTSEDCHRILVDWLSAFKDRHLGIVFWDKAGRLQCRGPGEDEATMSRSAAPLRSPEPTAQVLSDDTFLMTIPSFALACKINIEALTKYHDMEIRRRPNLIIDVRSNGGGADHAYGSLSPYLYTQPVVEVGCDVLATKENADAWESLLGRVPKQFPEGAKKILVMTRVPDEEKGIRAEIAQTVKKMRAAPAGTFIPKNPDATKTFPEVFPRPSRVAVLIDGECASTTEQFLLEARQSKKVTLFGQPTAGILDYANVRLFLLPSGRCFLSIPTTRSRRLPNDPIDNIGIAADVRIRNLTAPQTPGDTAVDFVQDYLRHHPHS